MNWSMLSRKGMAIETLILLIIAAISCRTHIYTSMRVLFQMIKINKKGTEDKSFGLSLLLLLQLHCFYDVIAVFIIISEKGNIATQDTACRTSVVLRGEKQHISC